MRRIPFAVELAAGVLVATAVVGSVPSRRSRGRERNVNAIQRDRSKLSKRREIQLHHIGDDIPVWRSEPGTIRRTGPRARKRSSAASCDSRLASSRIDDRAIRWLIPARGSCAEPRLPPDRYEG